MLVRGIECESRCGYTRFQDGFGESLYEKCGHPRKVLCEIVFNSRPCNRHNRKSVRRIGGVVPARERYQKETTIFALNVHRFSSVEHNGPVRWCIETHQRSILDCVLSRSLRRWPEPRYR